MNPQKGDRVIDRWWKYWGTGCVIARTARTATVQFSQHRLRYDQPHFQFLRSAPTAQGDDNG